MAALITCFLNCADYTMGAFASVCLIFQFHNETYNSVLFLNLTGSYKGSCTFTQWEAQRSVGCQLCGQGEDCVHQAELE